MRQKGVRLDKSTYAAAMTFALVLSIASLSSCHHAARLPSAAPAAAGLSAMELARIEPTLQAYVDSGRIAGAVMAIARHGRVGYSETVGWSDAERRSPMRRDAIFRIYSMTKPVVAAGIMKLVDQNKLTLDDPVSKYIPA